MDSAYLQRVRFQLQKRVRRLNSCAPLIFHSSLVQFWNYLQSQPLTAGILGRLEVQSPAFGDEIEAITSQHLLEEFTTEAEQSAFVFRIIEHCARQPLGSGIGPEVKLGHAISSASKHDEALNQFREMFLEPFYEYLDEALDQQGAVLSLLIKYKRKVEWFERDALVARAAGLERDLAQHLYAFLFDQGLDFHIEPQSASGIADLVAPELVLDAKVFDGSRRGLAYLASGVHQVHTYTRDFNQEVGYLVVYKTCSDTIDFTFSQEGQLLPYLSLGGKIIYLLVIDICGYEASASKRGTMRIHAVDQESLVRMADGIVTEEPDDSTAIERQTLP
ncbi:hypothetical protein [Cupriavidus basilensis]|uniref:hypothetical protein n=1 Tax=Cupriavidus basilensis TaxID=68895 RepID=UPI0039F709DE